MPLLSQTDSQNFMSRAVPMGDSEIPTFQETAAASFAFVRDEELSISSQFYNGGYYARRGELVKLADEGFDTRPYIGRTGSIDYDRLSKDTNGRIKTDSALRLERNEILRKKRNQNQDVMDRGSGVAQFFGMMGGYMSDPINIATLPVGGVGTVGKGMSVLSKALLAGRNTAAVAVATEAAIQPLVYTHKQDIDSPYDISDSLTAIGMAAGGSFILGGAIGGVSGYLGKLAEDADVALKPYEGVFPRAGFRYDAPKVLVRREQADALSIITDRLNTEAKGKISAAQMKGLKSQLNETRNNLKSYLREDPEVRLEGDALPFDRKPLAKGVAEADIAGRAERQKSKEFLESKVKQLEDRIAVADQASKSAEYVNQLSKGQVPGPVARELADVQARPSTPESESIFLLARFAENLRVQKGFRANEVVMRAVDEAFAEGTLTSVKATGIKAIDKELAGLKADDPKFAELTALKNSMEDIDDDGIFFFDIIRQKNIEDDLALLMENEQFRKQMDEFTLSPDDFVGPVKPKPPRASATNLERDAFDRDGLGSNYDADMAAYNNVDVKYAVVDGKLVDAEVEIKKIDEDLEGLESIMRCSIG